jgi:hypothetical protein
MTVPIRRWPFTSVVAAASLVVTTTGASTMARTGASVTTSRPMRNAVPPIVTELPGDVRNRSSGNH